MKSKNLKNALRRGYDLIAGQRSTSWDFDPIDSEDLRLGNAASTKAAVARRDLSCTLGYTRDDLAKVPEGSNMNLGCGNPIPAASLKAEECVLDLGSGAGLDCFLAAENVGPKGKAVGLDMTHGMVSRARSLAIQGGYQNVTFCLGDIEALPFRDSSIEAVLSNCAINLVPDKKKAFKEALRVLKPGGRLSTCDIVLIGRLPKSVRSAIKEDLGVLPSLESKEGYLGIIRSCGFAEVEIISESPFPAECMAEDISGRAIQGSSKISSADLKEIGRTILSLGIRAVKCGSALNKR
jgi:arsenite methyltransferase